jgi:ubiquinone/menaquinone biosynthesis C-methylase UbiE
MPQEFDPYVESYRDIINSRAAISGDKFEDFIELRVRLMHEDRMGLGLAAPSAILDFGCGIGVTAKILRQRYPNSPIHGVDASPESIKSANALGVAGATFHVAEGSLPFSDASFDLIYSNGTFHHIDRAQHGQVLRELSRVLSPGGTLFIFENNPFNPLMVYGMWTNPFDKGTKMLMPWYLRRLIRDALLEAAPPRFYYFFPRYLARLRWMEPHLSGFPAGAQYYVRGRKVAR